jgi:hypothetical protein
VVGMCSEELRFWWLVVAVIQLLYVVHCESRTVCLCGLQHTTPRSVPAIGWFTACLNPWNLVTRKNYGIWFNSRSMPRRHYQCIVRQSCLESLQILQAALRTSPERPQGFVIASRCSQERLSTFNTYSALRRWICISSVQSEGM